MYEREREGGGRGGEREIERSGVVQCISQFRLETFNLCATSTSMKDVPIITLSTAIPVTRPIGLHISYKDSALFAVGGVNLQVLQLNEILCGLRTCMQQSKFRNVPRVNIQPHHIICRAQCDLYR